MTRVFTTRHLLAVALLLILPLTHAAVPNLINYQGVVTDTAGEPLDGNYAMAFVMWTSSTGGTIRWQEEHASVKVTEGLFAVLLGSQGTPLTDSVLKTSQAWLEITVAGATLKPRTQMTSTGYAHRVSTVDGASAGTVNGELTVDGSLQVIGQFAPTGGIIMPSGITIQSTGNNVLIIAGSSQITISPTGGVTIQSSIVTISATDELNLSATNKVVIDAPWIDIHSTDSLNLRSDTDINLTAGTFMDLTAAVTMDLDAGNIIDLTASNKINLQAGGLLDLNGGIIQIN